MKYFYYLVISVSSYMFFRDHISNILFTTNMRISATNLIIVILVHQSKTILTISYTCFHFNNMLIYFLLFVIKNQTRPLNVSMVLEMITKILHAQRSQTHVQSQLIVTIRHKLPTIISYLSFIHISFLLLSWWTDRKKLLIFKFEHRHYKNWSRIKYWWPMERNLL